MSGCIDPLSLALSQITYLLSNLGKKNAKSSTQEIVHLVSEHGSAAERHLIRCLFSYADFSSDNKASQKDHHQIQYLNSEIISVLNKPNFTTLLSHAFDKSLLHQQRARLGLPPNTGVQGHLSFGLNNTSLASNLQLTGSGGLAGNPLHQISRVLKLTRLQEVVFALALSNSSIRETRVTACVFLRARLPEFLRLFVDQDIPEQERAAQKQQLQAEIGLDFSNPNIELLRDLIETIYSRDYGITPDLRENFFRMIRSEFPQNRISYVIAPLIYTEPQEITQEKLFPDSHAMPRSISEVALADVVKDMGTACMASKEAALHLITMVGDGELNSELVARVLAMVARSASDCLDSNSLTSLSSLPLQRFGLLCEINVVESTPKQWLIENFVDAVLEKAESLKWSEVVGKLEDSGLHLPNPFGPRSAHARLGFELLIRALVRGLGRQNEIFPIESVFKKWRQPEGQLAFVSCLVAFPDLLPLQEYPSKRVVLDSNPPILPENELNALQQNTLLSPWFSLDFIECLLRLSETGLYHQVLQLFAIPLDRCPEILIFSLLQAGPQVFNVLKRELLCYLLPVFFEGRCRGGLHTATLILHYAWSMQTNASIVRTLLLYSCSDWYLKSDFDFYRLTRIFEHAHDLKALQMLLNSPQLAFVIDLACLASKRNILKLDTWLNTKFREYGDTFAFELIRFLKRRCHQLFASTADLERTTPKELEISPMVFSSQAPGTSLGQPPISHGRVILRPYGTDVVSLMLTALHSHASSSQVDPAIKEWDAILVKNCQQITNTIKRHQALLTDSGRGSASSNLASLIQSSANSAGGLISKDSAAGDLAGTLLPKHGSQLSSSSSAATASLQSMAFPPTGLGQATPGVIGSQHQPTFSTLISGATGASLDPLQNLFASRSSASANGFGSLFGTTSQMGQSGLASALGLADNAFKSNLGQLGQMGMQMNPPMSDSTLESTASNLTFGMSNPHSSAGVGARDLDNQASHSSLGSSSWGISQQGSLGVLGASSSSTGQGVIPLAPGAGVPVSSENTNISVTSELISSTASTSTSILPVASSSSDGASCNTTGSATLTAATGASSVSVSSSSLGGGSGANGAGRQPLGGCAPPEVIERALQEFPTQFTKETEDEANLYFQRLYYTLPTAPTVPPGSQQLTVDEMLELLRQFKDSNNQREQVYFCMLRNLFEEYTFFPEYPDTALLTSAVLFGGLIEYGLLPQPLLMLALFQTLDALRKMPPNRMHSFGLTALDRFKFCLKEYSGFCQALVVLESFQALPAILQEFVTYASRGEEHPNSRHQLQQYFQEKKTSQSLGATAATIDNSKRLGMPSGGANIQILLNETREITNPSLAIQDKVFFIFNNLSLANISNKVEELKGAVPREYMPWVAQYLVMRRVSSEPNFHNVYANFVDALKMPECTENVLQETYRNIKVLLRSDKGSANFSDRTLLKNFGHWLGMITLARDRPINTDDLDPKSLIYEAYHRSTEDMLYVVPFVAKILESAAKSRAFRYPSPWTKGIMSAFAELHNEDNVKLNLKFEIEVLCKTLQVDLTQLNKNGNYLKDTSRLATLESQLKPIAQPERSDAPASATTQPFTATTASVSLPAPLNTAVLPPLPSVVPLASDLQKLFVEVARQPPPSTTPAQVASNATVGEVTSMSLADVSNATNTVAIAGPSQVAEGPVTAVSPKPVQMTQMTHGSVPAASVSVSGASVTSGLQVIPLPMAPFFSFDTIQSTGTNYGQLARVSESMLTLHPPSVHAFIRIAFASIIEQAVPIMFKNTQELILRNAMTACQTSLMIAGNDFARDPEEARLFLAAQAMVRHVASALSLSCFPREEAYKFLTSQILGNNNFIETYKRESGCQLSSELLEKTAEAFAFENLELLIAFYVKCCSDRALSIVSEKLVEKRRQRAHEGLEMPMRTRSRPMAVYENFARSIPGFSAPDSSFLNKMMSLASMDSSTQGPSHMHVSTVGHSQQPPARKMLDDALIESIRNHIEKHSGHVNVLGFQLMQIQGQNQSTQAHLQPQIFFKVLRESLEAVMQMSNELRITSICAKILENLIEIYRHFGNALLAAQAQAQRSAAAGSEVNTSLLELLNMSFNFLREFHGGLLKSTIESKIFPRGVLARSVTETLVKFIREGRIYQAHSHISSSGSSPISISSIMQLNAVGEFLASLIQPGHRLVNLALLDMELARTIDTGALEKAPSSNFQAAVYAVDAVIQILKHYCLVQHSKDIASVNLNISHEFQVSLSIEAVCRICVHQRTSSNLLTEQQVLTLEYLRTAYDSTLIYTEKQHCLMGTYSPMNVSVPVPGSQPGAQAPVQTTTQHVQNSGISSPQYALYSSIAIAYDADEHSATFAMRETAFRILQEWIQIYSSNHGCETETEFKVLLSQPPVRQLLAVEDNIFRFCRASLLICIEHIYSDFLPGGQLNRQAAFDMLDGVVRLYIWLIRILIDSSRAVNRLIVINKLIGIIIGTMMHDHEVRQEAFCSLIYFRLLFIFWTELFPFEEPASGTQNAELGGSVHRFGEPTAAGASGSTTSLSYSPIMKPLELNLLVLIHNVLHLLRPTKMPGFTFDWFRLVTERTLMPRFLGYVPGQNSLTGQCNPAIGKNGSILFSQLFVDALRFVSPFLRNLYLTKGVQMLLKGLAKMLFVLLNDFPEFLSEHYYSLVDPLPPNAIHLRNLILSAYPRNIRVPDPSFSLAQLNTRLETIEFEEPAVQRSLVFEQLIRNESFRVKLEQYLKTRSPVTFLSEILSVLQVKDITVGSSSGGSGSASGSSGSGSSRYNIQFINSLVFYLGLSALNVLKNAGLGQAQGQAAQGQTPVNWIQLLLHDRTRVYMQLTLSHTDLFETLVRNLDTEGRYLLFVAISSHLRYPNQHTFYFMGLVMHFFSSSGMGHAQGSSHSQDSPVVREQILRVLVERVLVQRPIPWGIVVLMLELVHDQSFALHEQEYIHFDSTLEKLIEKTKLSVKDRSRNAAPIARPMSAAASQVGTAASAPLV